MAEGSKDALQASLDSVKRALTEFIESEKSQLKSQRDFLTKVYTDGAGGTATVSVVSTSICEIVTYNTLKELGAALDTE